MSEKAEYDDWLILDPATLAVIGAMTRIECECRDAWSAADPQRATWTATRHNRIQLSVIRGR